MIAFIVIVLAIILPLSLYYFYFKPKHAIDQFVDQAKKVGYRVKTIPYNPFNLTPLKFMKQDEQSLRVFKE